MKGKIISDSSLENCLSGMGTDYYQSPSRVKDYGSVSRMQLDCRRRPVLTGTHFEIVKLKPQGKGLKPVNPLL